MTRPLDVAVIGAGSMGRHHARIVSDSGRARLVVLIDPAPEARELAARLEVAWTPEVSAAEGCQAAIVAAPTELHAAIGIDLLRAGVPTFIEKPLAHDLAAAQGLVDASAAADVPLMCGFVERFNPVIAAARSILDGPPTHLVAMRHSPPAERIRTDVVYDLLIHDLDIAAMVNGSSPDRVVSSCWAPDGAAVNEIADATVTFADGGMATLSASRASQRKTRSIVISTPTSQIELDLVRQDITVYRHVRHEISTEQTYRAETVVDIPFVRHAGEPLKLQFERFVGLIDGSADADAERRSLLPGHVLADAVLAGSLESSNE